MSVDQEKSKAAADQLLNLYLRSQTDREAEPILVDIITNHAEPLIRKIVLTKISTHDELGHIRVPVEAEDLCSTIKLKLLSRLRRLRSSSKTEEIESFLDYVAVASFNVCNEYFRQLNPVWLRIRNHIRYILNHDREFALWKIRKHLVCGFAKWKNQNEVCAPEILKKLVIEDSCEDSIRGQLRFIFEKTSLPARFVEVVNLFVRSLEAGNEKCSQESMDFETIPDTSQSADKYVELRTFLADLWKQILDLSLKQRTALLLSLRDENGSAVLHFFPMLGIAKIKEIAATLEMVPERFATLWRDLPLEDNRIAEDLQITRQQVINLRKCARERLVRKLK
jgi:hypothetical protein